MLLKSLHFKRFATFFTITFSIALYFHLGYNIERYEHVILGLCVLGLFMAYYGMLKLKISWVLMVVAGLLFRTVFLGHYPALSQDFFRFIWDGRLLFKGINPYLFTPNEIMNSQVAILAEMQTLYDGMGPLSQRNFSNYPPIHQMPGFLAAMLSGRSIFGTILILRLILILADLGIVYYGRKLLGLFQMPKNAIFIYFLNPLVVIELTGNLHFEGLMVFFMLLTFYHLKQNKNMYAALFMGISILTKLIPVLVLPLFIYRLGLKKSVEFVGMTIGVVILGFVPFINMGFLTNYSESVGLWFSNFEFNASFYYMLKALTQYYLEANLIAYMRFIIPALMGSTVLYLYLKKEIKTKTIMKQCLWLLTAYFFIATTIHPWYIIPLVFLSCYSNYRYPIWWSLTVFLSYGAYSQTAVLENPYLLAIEYGVVLSVLIYESFKNSSGKLKHH